ncbi:sorbitol dehydrogenase-like protein [Halteromyces radiatus]|uniref:sorbitol dehydrogenase-like protein n=1 Tax=Halteromyces radiatus TaxID=101107 RepID=UPI0022201C7B|nr:sorbitol dehydrogenase-like protein [Halteromyces radiatus]KAI8096353.1 sorbitol dehydrogenase-like protein [Halteromyces radiatus]
MTFKTKDENIAAVLYGAHDLRVEKRPIPQPQAGEVLLRIKATGICGSDLHYYLDGGLGPRRIDSSKPMILGHESAGIVVSIGDDTTKLKVGDRVVIEPGRSCGVCSYCCQGRYNLCPKMKFSSSLLQGPNDGSLCRYACFPENLCHRLPDNMSFDDGALIEPLAVALHSVERTPIKVGSTVHVFGAGPVGLLTAAVAFVKGAVNCTIFDINQDRLDFAKKYLPNGVRVVLLPKIKFQNAEDTITWAQDNAIHFLRDLSNDDSDNFADVVFECTGVAECIMLSMYVVQRGGTVMLIGLGRDKTLMPTDIITTREVDIRGNFRYANVHKKAITLVEQGRINLSSLVSHRFKLENSNILACLPLPLSNADFLAV